ncbi:MAG TPA: hypothetical protein VFS00_29800, partial [Polyangiaceae bacterium]|nr:hypothetical protein [Polyangiaceae bacterium]
SGGSGGSGGAGGAGGAGQPGPSGSFALSISGEDLALEGYPFEPGSAASAGDPPAFVDGWAITFEHFLITVGNVRLNRGPDADAADPTRLGDEVARDLGPWVVDVANRGAAVDKGSGQPGAWPLTTITGDFDPSERYAFSYDTLAASAAATRVGFKEGSEALYQQAVQRGWAMVFQGTATFVGAPGAPPPPPFDAFSKPVAFTIGLANPIGYVNCENPDLSSGDGAARGVQTLPNQAAAVQITIHTDHLFWNTLDVEGTPLHFDHLASQARFDAANPAAPGELTSDDLAGVLLNTMYVRGTTTTLPSRTYVDDYTPTQGTFVPNPGGTGITTLLDYLAYSQASGGHLNADGE